MSHTAHDSANWNQQFPANECLDTIQSATNPATSINECICIQRSISYLGPQIGRLVVSEDQFPHYPSVKIKIKIKKEVSFSKIKSFEVAREIYIYGPVSEKLIHNRLAQAFDNEAPWPISSKTTRISDERLIWGFTGGYSQCCIKNILNMFPTA